VVEDSAENDRLPPNPAAAVPVEFTPSRAIATIEFVAALLPITVKLLVRVSVDAPIRMEPMPVDAFVMRITPADSRTIPVSCVETALIVELVHRIWKEDDIVSQLLVGNIKNVLLVVL